MVKCLPEFKYFNVFLKNTNFDSKIKRSKVTDYAALYGAWQNLSEPVLNTIEFKAEIFTQ